MSLVISDQRCFLRIIAAGLFLLDRGAYDGAMRDESAFSELGTKPHGGTPRNRKTTGALRRTHHQPLYGILGRIEHFELAAMKQPASPSFHDTYMLR